MEEGEMERVEVEGEETEVYPKEQLTAVDDVVLVKEEEAPQGEVTRHEIVGKEVYSEEGEYYGKVESVTLDEEGNVLEFMAVKGDDKRIIASSDIASRNGVILVKAG
jgi:sporulation protein YlmC with PRC-barrel domain